LQGTEKPRDTWRCGHRQKLSDTAQVQAYTVASGIIVEQEKLLLVQNKRRNGSLDWSTPGGVVDPGEEVLEALQREVLEETSVAVKKWSSLIYSVDVDFVGRDMSLHAQVFQALGHRGSLHIDDPDNVVVAGRWAGHDEASGLLDMSPRWVHEPVRHALYALFLGDHDHEAPSSHWQYRVTGTGRDYQTELVRFEDGSA